MMDGVICLDDANDDEGDENHGENVTERTKKGSKFLAFESHRLPAQ
jgi:hypothetical protein